MPCLVLLLMAGHVFLRTLGHARRVVLCRTRSRVRAAARIVHALRESGGRSHDQSRDQNCRNSELHVSLHNHPAKQRSMTTGRSMNRRSGTGGTPVGDARETDSF